jgi:hypothetical protein
VASVRFADCPAKPMTARGDPGTAAAGSAGRLAATVESDGANVITGGLAKIGPDIGALVVGGGKEAPADGAADAAAGGAEALSRGPRKLPSGIGMRRLSIGPGGGGRRLAARSAAWGDPGTGTRAGRTTTTPGSFDCCACCAMAGVAPMISATTAARPLATADDDMTDYPCLVAKQTMTSC